MLERLDRLFAQQLQDAPALMKKYFTDRMNLMGRRVLPTDAEPFISEIT